MRVLVVEDDPDLGRQLSEALSQAGYAVDLAPDGEEGHFLGETEPYDAAVLDLGLPDIDGLDVTRAIRKEGNTPIIMLTARGEESDKLVGLELGADDYIVKPFSPKELVARARAVLRRAEVTPDGANRIIRIGDLTIDPPRRRVTLNNQLVELTSTEFQLLSTLVQQPGRIFTRSQLLDAVRGLAVESYERAIDAHIKNLRRKIEPDSREPRYILTVYGVGYKFSD